MRLLTAVALMLAVLAGSGPGETATAPAAIAASAGGFAAAAQARLAMARETYQAIVAAGGWPSVATKKLSLGTQAPEVLVLRTRLQRSGDLASDAPPSDIFDAVLDEAVRRFQRRHGLEVDGIVGPRTRSALNVSAADRLASIELNLRRVAILPLAAAGTQLLLNIAGAELLVLDDGAQVAVHRAIVGRRDWQTPLLTSAITRLDLNPAWTVPPRIVREELLPHMRRDPGYLAREGILMLRDPQTDAVIYRQPPGPQNPLGVVRFFFPNPYSVFLHDTPAKALFERAERTFSHGCVRLEGALDLALYLLRDEPGWSAERVAAVLATRTSQSVDLSRPVPITLAYLTAWVDEAGALQFREDVYGRDRRDEAVLAAVQTACGA